MIHRLANAEQGDYAEEGKLPGLFYEATITLIPKPDQIKKKRKKENYGPISLSTTNWHLPRALPMTEQQMHLPSASVEIEPHAAVAVDLQHPLREFRAE